MKEAFGQMLGVIGEAIDLAEDAIKEAEARPSSPPPVTLVKVAYATAQPAAARLMKTGAFGGYTEESLARTIEKAGPADLLEMMEKLASRSVFPLDSSLLDETGDLVEKSATPRRVPAESRSDLWLRSMEEAGYDVSGQ